MSISIIIPTLNEEKNIGELLSRIKTTIKNNYEVIIIDGKSKDNTIKVLKKFKKTHPLKILLEKKEGLSGAVCKGFTKSKFKTICVMDADLQHPPEVLPKLIEASKKSDIVIASRYLEGNKIKNWSKIRLLISLIAKFFVKKKLPFLKRINDPLSGFFIIKQKILPKTLNHQSCTLYN